MRDPGRHGRAVKRMLGACLSIPRGRERDGFAFSRGGADELGFDPNEEATTTNEGKSAAPEGLALEGASAVLRGLPVEPTTACAAPCIRSLAEPTRLTWNTQTGSSAGTSLSRM